MHKFLLPSEHFGLQQTGERNYSTVIWYCRQSFTSVIFILGPVEDGVSSQPKSVAAYPLVMKIVSYIYGGDYTMFVKYSFDTDSCRWQCCVVLWLV